MVKSHPFKDDVPPDLEEFVKLRNHGLVLLAVISSNVRGCEGIVVILTHVEEHGDLLLLCF